MLERLSHEELKEYFAYYLLEPFGETRGDIRSAQQSAIAIAAAGGKPGEPRKYMPFEHQRTDLIEDWKLAKAMLAGAIVNANAKTSKQLQSESKCLDE